MVSSQQALRDWLAAGASAALDVALVNASDIVAIVDRDLLIRYISYTQQGFTKEQTLGAAVLDITPPDYHALSQQKYEQVFQTGMPTRYEVVYKDKEQLHVWDVRLGPILLQGEVAGVITINTEVSEQRRQSVERDRFFLLSLDMLAVTSAQGQFRRVNPALGQVLGRELSELLEHPFLEFVHAEDREKSQRAFESVLASKPVTDFENRYRCKDGTYRVFSWRSTSDPMTGDIYSVARDVTEQRNMELQLLQAQKMEAIGQLAGGVAHDFNNLLLAVLANAELAMQEEALTPDLAEHLEGIREAGRRAAALTKQLLAFSRQQPIRPVSVDLNDLLRSLLKLLERLLPENITLELIPGHKLARVSADKSQLEQVIVNLCVNARDAMPNGGRLTIETENLFINERYAESFPWAVPGRYVLLSVTDTGVGMTQEARERAFEPFFTTKPLHQGTGLGLSTVYGIVRQHEGMVHLYSEVGLGTTFKVYLPTSERAAEDVGDKLPSVLQRGKETLLLAEDERRVRSAVAKILERAGYRVLVANDGAEAVELIRGSTEPVHLAILDVVMPELGGPDAWAQLRALRPEMRVLFASGYADHRYLAHLPAGVEMLEKPFQTETLLRLVRRALDGDPAS